MSRALEGRIALITGATRGIGRATAERFAAEGATVVAVGRTRGALEELDDAVRAGGGTCVLVDEDLRQHEKIDQIGASLYQRYGRLDVFVGNAAVLGRLEPLTHTDPERWAEVIDVNLTVNWRLLRSLDPLLKASDAGRAILMTSGVARAPKAYWGAYAISKAAVEAMAKVYAAETVKTPVRVNVYDPGRTRTQMRAAAYPGENPDDLPPPAVHGDALVALAAADCTRHGEVVTYDDA